MIAMPSVAVACARGFSRRAAAAMICLMAAMSAQQAVAQQACPTLTVSTNDDDVNGDTSSPCNLIGDPGPDGISLREALLAANNASGSGTVTITFAPALAGTTIALTERFAPITRSQIALAGLTSDGQPNITLDATNASNPGAIFFIAASHFAMSGMNIVNLPTNFNAMQIGGFGYSLIGQMVSSPAQICCFQISGNAFGNGSDSGNGSMGIFIPPQDNDETISDLIVADNSFSQLFEAVNIGGGTPTESGSVIQDVLIVGNSFSQMTATGTSALEVGSEGTNNMIRRVEVVQNSFAGNFQGFVIDINGASSGNLIQNVLIARNSFSGNLGALGIVAGVDSGSDSNTVMNTQIVDNLVDLTGYQGQGAATIQIIDSQSGGTNDKVTGVSFVNNTIYNGASGSPPGWGVWVTSSGGVTGVNILNTVFWGNESSVPLNGILANQVGYSIIDQSGFSGTNSNINVDPMFVNAGGGNFTLQSGSPALHAGISAGAPPIDIDCQPRGSPPSIGAYEFEGPNICPATPAPELTDTHDFNGDGYSDILWRQNGSGELAMWLMSGSQVLSGANVAQVPSVWSVIGTRDFNGDGDADILWQDTSGDFAIWLMNGTALSSGITLGNVGMQWSVAGTGDFNADGTGDILWRNSSTGDVAIWLMSNGAFSSGADLGTVPLTWQIAGTGDFNGNGSTDILWRNSSTGDLAIWLMQNGQFSSGADLGTVPLSWTVVGTGDFNGDGTSDIVWRDSSGDLAIWLMSNGQLSSGATLGQVQTTWSVAETGDFNGDGVSDILWLDQSGDIALWLMNDATLSSGISLGNVGTTWQVQGQNAN